MTAVYTCSSTAWGLARSGRGAEDGWAGQWGRGGRGQEESGWQASGSGRVSRLLECQSWQLPAASSSSPAPSRTSQSPVLTGRRLLLGTGGQWQALLCSLGSGLCFPHAQECLGLPAGGGAGSPNLVTGRILWFLFGGPWRTYSKREKWLSFSTLRRERSESCLCPLQTDLCPVLRSRVRQCRGGGGGDTGPTCEDSGSFAPLTLCDKLL